jgi:hypothetical protein
MFMKMKMKPWQVSKTFDRRLNINSISVSVGKASGVNLLLMLSVILSILFPFVDSLAQNQQFFDFSKYGVRIEPDRRLIVVMASLEAAGGLNVILSKQGAGFRKQLREDLASLNPNTRQRLQIFLSQYKRLHPDKTPEQIIAAYVSLAFALSPVPDLQEPERMVDLPVELLDVLDFAPLVREFYRQSNIGTNLDKYYKIYQDEGDKMRASASTMILELMDYLHTRPQTVYIEKIKVETTDAKSKKKLQKIETRERERRFFIVPDMLAPVGTVNFLNIGNDYFVIVPPETNLSLSEARQAFLRFVLDPLIFQNAKEINNLSEQIRSLLEERRKENPEIPTDIFLAVLRSASAAVDIKQIEFSKIRNATIDARRRIELAKGDEERKKISAELSRLKAELADETAALLSEAYEKGAVLAFHFAEQLRGIEESGFDISAAFRNMILSIDIAKEKQRLQQFAEARKRASERKQQRKLQRAEILPREKFLIEKLLQIEEMIKRKEFEKADEELSSLMQEYPGEPRIFYARGRVSSLSAEQVTDENIRDQLLGKAAANYRNAILQANADTDPALIQRSHVSLARILEFNEQTEAALREYEAAIKLGQADRQAYQEALAGRERLLKKP